MALEKLSDIEKGIYTRVICPICKNETYDMYWICPVCGWQDDEVQNDEPDFEGGANDMSLNQAKEAYRQGKPVS